MHLKKKKQISEKKRRAKRSERSDSLKKNKPRFALKENLYGVWKRIKQIPWRSAFLWVCKIPWRPMWRGLCRFGKKRLLPLCCFFLCIGVLLAALVLSVSGAVCHKTGDRILTVEQVRSLDGSFDCILVFGCRVYADGTPSPMLRDRVQTAVSVWETGVSPTILMSGDSHGDYYDEVGTMEEVAVAAGVPEEAILTDAWGLSTYDSLSRLSEIWKGKRVIIVTQEYHLYRALYIAEKLGMEAYGVSADLRPYVGQIKYDVREIFARCKDVYYALLQPPTAYEEMKS